MRGERPAPRHLFRPWNACNRHKPGARKVARGSRARLGKNVGREKFLFLGTQEGAKIEGNAAVIWGMAAFRYPTWLWKPREGKTNQKVPSTDLAVCRSSGINVDETFEVQTAYTHWEPESTRAHKWKNWPVCGHAADAFRGDTEVNAFAQGRGVRGALHGRN